MVDAGHATRRWCRPRPRRAARRGTRRGVVGAPTRRSRRCWLTTMADQTSRRGTAGWPDERLRAGGRRAGAWMRGRGDGRRRAPRRGAHRPARSKRWKRRRLLDEDVLTDLYRLVGRLRNSAMLYECRVRGARGEGGHRGGDVRLALRRSGN